jgi:hypothetical protein
MKHLMVFEQFLEENKIQLPTWLFDDPEDFEEWYEDGMELEKGKIASLNSADEKKLLSLVKAWVDAEEDYSKGRGDLGTGRTGEARAASYKAQDDIKQMLTQKGKVVFEELVAEKNPAEIELKDEMRINDIIRKSGGDRSKAEALARTMASRITDRYKALRRSKAAYSLGHSNLAQIFSDRTKEL